jgi:hypothetical protein
MAISYLGQASNATKNGNNVAVDVSGIGMMSEKIRLFSIDFIRAGEARTCKSGSRSE